MARRITSLTDIALEIWLWTLQRHISVPWKFPPNPSRDSGIECCLPLSSCKTLIATIKAATDLASDPTTQLDSIGTYRHAGVGRVARVGFEGYLRGGNFLWLRKRGWGVLRLMWKGFHWRAEDEGIPVVPLSWWYSLRITRYTAVLFWRPRVIQHHQYCSETVLESIRAVNWRLRRSSRVHYKVTWLGRS